MIRFLAPRRARVSLENCKSLVALILIAFMGVLSGCGSSDSSSTSTPPTATPQLASIAVAAPDATLAAGLTQQYTATGVYSDGSKKEITSQVTWSSASAGVATVSAAAATAGLVTTFSPGSTTITARLDNVSGSTTLTVTAATLVSVGISPSNPSIASGLNQVLKATGVYTDYSTHDLTNAVTWTSSDASVASISNAAGTNGIAATAGAGSTTITATLGNLSVSTTLTVTPATLVSIGVTPATLSLAKGTSQQLTAMGVYTDSTTRNLTSAVLWTSSNSASVSIGSAAGSAGLATAASTGSATVTASLGGVSGQSAVTATAATLVSIAVTPGNASVPSGLTSQFIATGTYSDNSTQNLTAQVVWSSSNTSVAAVSNAAGYDGLASALSVGSVTITATLGAITGVTPFTISPATLVSISVTAANPSIATGLTDQFTATGVYSDNSTQNLTAFVAWTSSNASAASISNASGSQGLAAAVSPGSATITAARGTVSGTMPLIVDAASLVSMVVTPASPSISSGSREQFTATGIYSDNSTLNISSSVTWSSSNPSVATISNAAGFSGLASSTSPGSASITASSGSISGSAALTVNSASLVSIAITPSNSVIANGFTQQFAAIGTYSDNSTQDLTSSVTWLSTNTTAAVISNASGSYGLASSAGVGSTSIAATLGAITSAQASLTVTSASLVSISVTPANPSINAGTSEQFTAIGIFSDNSTQNLTSSVTWTSNLSAVSISNAAGSNGLATSTGTANVTITATSGSITGSTTLSVMPATLVSIQVSPATASIASGFTQQFTAAGMYSDNSVQDLSTQVSWISSNTAVATIDGNGLVSTLAPGSTGISATLNTISSAQVPLTVTSASLVSIAVTPANPSISSGSNEQFTATGTYSDNSTANITSAVTWSATNTSTVTISNATGSNGLASTTSPDSATITASVGSISGSTALTATSATLVSIAISPSSAAIADGTTQQFTATGTYTDNSTQDLTSSVTWSSTNSAAAAISNASGSSGLATSSNAGSTNIVATLATISSQAQLSVTSATLVSIAVTPANLYVVIGTTQQFIATGTFSDNSTQNLSSSVFWSSSNSAVATISNAAGSNGLVTVQGAATLGSTSTISAACSQASICGSIGGQTTLTATVGYSYAANRAANSVSQYAIGLGGVLVALSPSTVPSGALDQALAADPAGRYVYVTNTNDNSISQYTIGVGGMLAAMSPATVAAGTNPLGVAVDPSSRYVYVANKGTNTISQFTIGSGGALVPMSPATVSTGSRPFGVTVDPSGAYVYVANSAGSSVSEYAIGAGGALTPLSPATVATETSPLSVALDPTGKYAYVANQGSASVSQYTVGSGGVLAPMSPAQVATSSVNPQSVVVDPSGRYVYVADSGNQLSQYSIGSSGALTPLSPLLVSVAPNSDPWSLAIDPSGQYLYVAEAVATYISEFSISSGGTLTTLSPASVAAGSNPIAIITVK